MKVMRRKTVASVIACLVVCAVVCMSSVMPVYASSGFFSKSTTKLNAYSGGTSSTSSLSSGSTPDGATITQVQLECVVASGTDPYYLYVVSPSKTTYVLYVSSPASTTYYTNDFNSEDPYGTWTIYIKNANVTIHNNIIPTSTVTVDLKVYYEY